MYGSYGSYSAMCAQQTSSPIDISTGFSTSRASISCAFPSWPQRSSLSEQSDYRTSSYISDEDLFSIDADDDVRSVSSSGGSSVASPFSTSTSPHISTEQTILEMERARAAHQREVVAFLMVEKERRRQQQQQARKQRRGSSGSRKSPKNKQSAMTTITEGGE